MTQGFQCRIANVMTYDGRHFTFVHPITYVANDGRVFVIPQGATTDGASTPRDMWPFLPPFGEYWLATVLHDCSYQNTLQIVNEQGTAQAPANLPQDECDNLLKEAMESLGVAQLTVDTIYEGVHKFGWLAYRQDRLESSPEVIPDVPNAPII